MGEVDLASGPLRPLACFRATSPKERGPAEAWSARIIREVPNKTAER